MAYNPAPSQTVKLGDADFELPLREDQSKLGDPRTTVEYRYGETSGKGYSAVFRRLEEAHGALDSDGDADNGSFVALKIIPSTDVRQRRFNNFTVNLSLETPEGLQDTRLIFVALAPAGGGEEYFQQHIISVKDTETAELSLNIKPPLSEGGGKYTKATERTSDRKRLLKLKTRSRGIYKGFDNNAEFQIEPAVEEDGIGDCFAVAMIIQRDVGAQFYIRATTSADVSSRVQVTAMGVWRWAKGKRYHEELLIGPFGPSKSSDNTHPKAVDIKNLRAASDEVLRMHAYLHLPEKGDEKLFLRQRLEHQANIEESTGDNSSHPTTQSPAPTDQQPPSSPVLQRNQSDRSQNPAPANAEPKPVQVPKLSPSYVQSTTKPDSGVDEFPNTRGTPSSQVKAEIFQHRGDSNVSSLNSRAVRHRLMASHHQALARLHLEEAEDVERQVAEALYGQRS